jgi:hypothetical protein
MKHCPTCETLKSLDGFNIDRRSKDGHDWQCRECKTERRRKLRKKKPLYDTYQNMIDRCHNPKCKDYPDYGGRGIYVCNEWRSSFATFEADILASIGPRPSKSHSLDRINNDGGYERDPWNLRWAWPWQQRANQTRCKSKAEISCDMDIIEAPEFELHYPTKHRRQRQ